jgi:MoaA/NifB/PqqE/SkfB family radical SAM enzyme
MLTGGEPLMHPNLWPLCESLQAAGIGITLLTTGLLLKRHAANIVRYCNDVVVSLDGPEKVHDEIRGVPGAFASLAQGVEAVLSVETGGTGRTVSLSGRCTVQAGNCHALSATVAVARVMGLERISFLAADVSSEAFNRPGGWDSERRSQVGLDTHQLATLSAELADMERELALEFATGFIAESPVKLRQRLYGYFAALRGLAAFPTNVCNAPWVSSVIETDGTVRPCFFQPPLGNIHEAGSLEAVLNAPSAIAFRRRLDVGTDPICRKCVCTLALRESE